MATEWFISGNPKKYDCVNAFRDLRKIDWRQSTNVEAGDIVYIYVSGEEHAIRLKCKANKVDIKVPDIDDKNTISPVSLMVLLVDIWSLSLLRSLMATCMTIF